jgi:hypothetical protein
MFEKEAEEYADKDFGMYAPTDHERYAKETDWRNGAEFGYNKANEYAKTIIQDLLDNSDEYARERAMDFLEEEENEKDLR